MWGRDGEFGKRGNQIQNSILGRWKEVFRGRIRGIMVGLEEFALRNI